MRTLTYSTTTVAKNRTGKFTVKLGSVEGNEDSMSFSLQFDPKVITIDPVVSLGKDVPKSAVISTNFKRAGEGFIGVLVDATDFYKKSPKNKEVAVFKFKVLKEPEANVSELIFSDTPARRSLSILGGQLAEVKYNNGKVKVK